MTPLWAPEAINDLAALRAYIERDDPAASVSRGRDLVAPSQGY